MSEPVQLRVKRRRTEEAPDFLVLEGPDKDASQVRYVKKHKSDDAPPIRHHHQPAPIPAKPIKPFKTATAAPQRKASRRVFHLQPTTSVIGKRKGTEDRVATFVEQKKSRHNDFDAAAVNEKQAAVNGNRLVFEISEQLEGYKRPGRSSALSRTTTAAAPTSTSDEDQRKLQELADYMHQAAVQEVAWASRPKSVVPPKLSAERARQMHERRIATNSVSQVPEDHAMDSDDDYEIETYILAPSSGDVMETDNEEGPDSIGYLVISEQDQELWQTYLDDETDGREERSDDEDENAEDYYGADYPEDEVDSDDEFDRHAHGYRAAEEEWDEDTGTYSDDEYDQMMNPFQQGKIPRRLAKYFAGHDDDNNDDS